MAFPLIDKQTLSTGASPGAVWRAFTRVELWPQVLPSVISARLEPAGAFAGGSRILTRATPASAAADLEYRIVAAEAPRRLVLEIEDTDYRATTEYVVAAVPDAAGMTDLAVTSRLEAHGLSQITRFLLWRERLTPFLSASARQRGQAFLALAERIGEND
jgi:uncharacterized protein YndB with AHSA1/START domain